MNELELSRIVNNLQSQNIPILAVIGVLGTTEFGTIDPINEIVKLRDQKSKQGLNFYIHIDAAWGGYLTSLFRKEDGRFEELESIKKELQYFPSKRVYQSFKALSETDSRYKDYEHW